MFLFSGGDESAVDLLELEDLTNEEISVSASHFRVGDVNHVFVDVEINLRGSGLRSVIG